MINQETLDELLAWLPSETDDFNTLVLRIIASLPGGEELEALGYEPLSIGWKEIELLGKLLTSLNDASDVKKVANALINA